MRAPLVGAGRWTSTVGTEKAIDRPAAGATGDRVATAAAAAPSPAQRPAGTRPPTPTPEPQRPGQQNTRGPRPSGAALFGGSTTRDGRGWPRPRRTPSPIRTVPSAPESHRILLARRRALARGLYRRSGLGRHRSPASPRPEGCASQRIADRMRCGERGQNPDASARIGKSLVSDHCPVIVSCKS